METETAINGSNVELLKRLWKDAEFAPNDNQREAILYTDGPLYLPAGPGSGKTRVLLWRAINLIVNHGLDPKEIYLSTFTEKAALQLRDGLRAMLGAATAITNKPYDISRMYVGTVHSLCQRLLGDRRFLPDRHRARPPVIKDELAQYMFIRRKSNWKSILEAGALGKNGNRVINEMFNERGNSRHKAISNLIAFFNRMSEEVIDPGAALKRTTSADLKKLVRMYSAYLDLLRNEGGPEFTDLSLLQQQAVRVVENNGHLRHVFRHVIIDEYQDTNTVQEKLFFLLSQGYGNICVVGDDDQALYRFRGATVENFVEFPARCRKNLGREVKTVVLGTNYRSRNQIVEFCNEFIRHPYCNWRKASGRGFYRVVDKEITAARRDKGKAAIASTPGEPGAVAAETAGLVRRLLDDGRVQDPSQIAFLFPSLRSPQVQRMREGLESEGLEVYAPRAGSFLDVPESVAIFGLLFDVFGLPEYDHTGFQDWVAMARNEARQLLGADANLKNFIKIRNNEVRQAAKDYTVLEEATHRAGWERNQRYDPAAMRPKLLGARGLSDKSVRALKSAYFDRMARDRFVAGRPFKLQYIVNRASSLDWNVLDLFYQLCGFAHFKEMFDAAEMGTDEGPICNLSLISQYLATFVDEYSSMITGSFLRDNGFLNLFSNFLYILFRRGESEYEDSEDPFPKGRIPFITIHQAKGLEFPVVVLANPRKKDNRPQLIETMVQPLLKRKGEPLDRMARFDVMRMFYVALSRAKNLLVVAHYKGQGQHIHEPFADLLENVVRIPKFQIRGLPTAGVKNEELPHTFSYTGDYLFYRKCPRQYMIYRKYGFVPARSQTMFFGSLVHQTLEDLHQRLISSRGVL
jgi:DNA helicase II / ATP-dependent DNA helicase PcrA